MPIKPVTINRLSIIYKRPEQKLINYSKSRPNSTKSISIFIASENYYINYSFSVLIGRLHDLSRIIQVIM